MAENFETSTGMAPSDAIDGDLPTPLYHQIYVLLREKIISGAYPDGSLIPSEHELEKMFGVSRITAKRALDELASEGLVSRRRGRGTTVTFKSPSSSAAGNMEGLIENLLMMGLETDVEMLQFDYVPAPPQIADALHLDPGALVQRAVRVRKKDGRPFSYLVTHVPADIGRSYTREEMADQPLLALLERTGNRIARARQTITATLADNAIGPALMVKVSSPLLKVSRIVFDESERPVEHINAYYRPDLYQLNLNLSRVHGDEVNTWAAHH